MNCPFCERRRCDGQCAEAVAHRAGMLERDPFGDDTFVPLETQLRPPPPPPDERGHTVVDEANELCARVRSASRQDMVAVRARPTMPARAARPGARAQLRALHDALREAVGDYCDGCRMAPCVCGGERRDEGRKAVGA